MARGVAAICMTRNCLFTIFPSCLVNWIKGEVSTAVGVCPTYHRDFARNSAVSQSSRLHKPRNHRKWDLKFNKQDVCTLFSSTCTFQKVTVTLVSHRTTRELSLEADSSDMSAVNIQSFVDEQEWHLYNNVETESEIVMRIYQGDNSQCPSFSALCYASRRFGFYAWNIMFVMVTELLC
jgi:hypothetical protein